MNKADFNISFGSYMKSVRVKNGITQIDLASAMNISPQNVSAIERGEVSPTLYWIHNLCLALKVDHNEFLQGLYNELNKNKISEKS